MVIDTSALVAILNREPEAQSFIDAIAADSRRLISAATLQETVVVIASRYGEAGLRELDLFLHKAAIETVPFGAEQQALAREAFLTFGRGRHPARLNFGDCFSYALSKSSGEALLFKGHDFSQTDVRPAIA